MSSSSNPTTTFKEGTFNQEVKEMGREKLAYFVLTNRSDAKGIAEFISFLLEEDKMSNSKLAELFWDAASHLESKDN